MSRRRLKIAAGGKASFHVSVQVPEAQRSGEYLSGVAIEARGQSRNPAAGNRVAIVSAQRFVIGMQVNVPGPRRPALRFRGARVERLPAGVTFLLRMRNPGTAILKNVRGRVEVSRDGRRVVAQPIGPGTFVSGTAIDFPVPAARERPPAGTRYRVRARVRYAGGRVVTLDEAVTFGSRQAERQEQYGGPAASVGTRPWLWPALAAAGLLLAMVLLLARRRRRLPSRTAGLRLIERELAALERTGRPLSVAVIGPVPPERAKRRRVIRQIKERLRAADTLCALSDDELLVIARDTGERAAIVLSEDLERLLANGGPAMRVQARTAAAPTTPAELLGRTPAASVLPSRTTTAPAR